MFPQGHTMPDSSSLLPRHESIIRLLQSFRQITVAELTQRLGVSQVTIRKDLTHLEEQGLVQRTHGSARLAQSIGVLPSVQDRTTSHEREKQAIVHRALELIAGDDAVAIDAGSTTLMLARELYARPLRLFTNSLDIASSLRSSLSVSLTLSGGSFRREAGSFIGPIAVEAVEKLRFDIAFIGATSFTARGEFFTQNSIEGSMKQAMLRSAARRVILADSSKFNARGFSRFAVPGEVDLLITDEGFTQADALRREGVEVLLASPCSPSSEM